MKARETHWVRAGDTVARTVENEVFVAVPRAGTIHTLNPMASALWRAIATPRTSGELCALVEAAFPKVDAGVIRSDIEAMLQTFESNGLALRANRR